ncbi:hypothetical protein [Streptomyces sp. NPDC051218]|uniref:hypothetical protein n=1 Tax=Streptomyces sp. NPDC051218 TaxID=3365645 RepID=UPI0037B8267E
MRSRKTLRPCMAACLTLLALALTACSGSEDGSGDKPSASKGVDMHRLKAGQSITASFREAEGDITYTAVAQKVDLGTEAEAKELAAVGGSLVTDVKIKGLVPAVAHVKYTSKGGVVLNPYPDVGDIVEIYADGRRGIQLLERAHEEPGCVSDRDIAQWDQGRSYVLCQTFMVPKGTKDLAVHWKPRKNGMAYVWKFKTP